MDKYVKVPPSDEDARSEIRRLCISDRDHLYSRDAAHKRMQEVLTGEKHSIGMKNNVIYYMGPSPAREACPIGSGQA